LNHLLGLNPKSIMSFPVIILSFIICLLLLLVAVC